MRKGNRDAMRSAHRAVRATKFDNSDGRELSWFESRFNESKFVRLPSAAGILPLNELP